MLKGCPDSHGTAVLLLTSSRLRMGARSYFPRLDLPRFLYRRSPRLRQRLSLSHARAHGPAGRGARVVPDLHNVLALTRGHDIPVAVHDQVVIRVGATTHAVHGVVGVLTDGREEGGGRVDHDQASFFLVWVAALRSAWATS